MRGPNQSRLQHYDLELFLGEDRGPLLSRYCSYPTIPVSKWVLGGTTASDQDKKGGGMIPLQAGNNPKKNAPHDKDWLRVEILPVPLEPMDNNS